VGDREAGFEGWAKPAHDGLDIVIDDVEDSSWGNGYPPCTARIVRVGQKIDARSGNCALVNFSAFLPRVAR